ncbi:short chain dehydrogenase [Amylocarpus encephaloides]|uniref:Short chain dehydrogenase n=1 Tax=Amylocarpus encephaloides TaxID=45428 RepID=A0A9P7YBM4_9HELO|nr:short chain dehydrogenase [Amylocarpus encephaloides]
MEGKTIILITGANSGVGLEGAKVLSGNSKNHVIIGARSQEKGEKAVSELKPAASATLSNIVIDITDKQSLEAAVAQIDKEFGRLDVLCNNAGIISWSKDVFQNLQDTFNTNLFGAVAATELFMPLILKSKDPRVINTSSNLGSIGCRSDPNDPYYGMKKMADTYRMSKAAMNMLTACTLANYGDQGVKAWSFCPGYVVTNLSGTGEKGRQERIENGAGDASISGRTLAGIIDGKEDANVGKFVHKDGVYMW